jgi:hypothetical protein
MPQPLHHSVGHHDDDQRRTGEREDERKPDGDERHRAQRRMMHRVARHHVAQHPSGLLIDGDRALRFRLVGTGECGEHAIGAATIPTSSV